MKKDYTKNKKGFTLVETLVAVLILTLTLTTMISLSTGSFYNVRYAQNQIGANMLAQEMIEYIRYTRDTAVQQNPETGFDEWLHTLRACESEDRYCTIEQFKESNEVIGIEGLTRRRICPRGTLTERCVPSVRLVENTQQLVQLSSGFYTTAADATGNMVGGTMTPSLFSRGVRVQTYGTDQVEVFVRVDWKNGSFDRSLTESVILTRW